MWTWITDPAMTRRRAWWTLLGGSLFFAFGVLFLTAEHDVLLRVGYALWPLVGLRWIVPSVVRIRKGDKPEA